MKKRENSKRELLMSSTVLMTLILALFFAFSSLSPVQAQDTHKVIKAYDWLVDQTHNWDKLNLKQHSFSLLALSCNGTFLDDSIDSLNHKSFVSPKFECFGQGPGKPSSIDACLITETVLAELALDSVGEHTGKIKNWLFSRNTTQVDDIFWYLQIDVERGFNASCEIIYGGNEESGFIIGEEKNVSITGNSQCFTVDSNEHWFRIKSNEQCYSQTYSIKCFSEAPLYTSTLLYKKNPLSPEWFVSGDIKTGKPGVPGSERIEDAPTILELAVQSSCLANPGQQQCDYEGTAWASMVLQAQGKDVSQFLPYLTIFADTNTKFFPQTFLYKLTSQTRYSNVILNAQNIITSEQGYWLIQPITYGRVYDSSLASLSLRGFSQDAITKVKNYLLANQGKNGNLVSTNYGESEKESIRDTAFALSVLWPELCPGASDLCEAQGPGFSCEDSCGVDEIQTSYLCDFGICCQSLEFVGSCSDQGGTCKSSCSGSEFEVTADCDSEVCCVDYGATFCSDIPSAELCDVGGTCVGDEVSALDSYAGTCCVGTCISGNLEDQDCVDVGIECQFNEACVDSFTWQDIPFEQTLDSDRCCVDNRARCVQDVLCEDIGVECSGDCSLTEETRDVEECCVGTCLQTCPDLGGEVCLDNEKCSGSTINSVDGACCLEECKEKKGISTSLLIIIVVVLALVLILLYLFKFRKPGGRAARPKFRGMPPYHPPTRPMRPRPMRPMPRQPATKPAALTRTVPTPRYSFTPRPAAHTRMAAMKQSTQAAKHHPQTKTASTRASRTRTKGRTEDELGKTLKKLKQMTREIR